MKSIYKILSLLLVVAIAGIYWSCSDEDEPNGGNPMISYVRITDPQSSDSLLVAAGQGQMVAIMGENLGDVRALWFNDQRASLTPTFITDQTIITRVPSQIPTEITNKMRLIFGNGRELVYDFSVDISEPVIEYMRNEYVGVGDLAVITGNFFYEPIKVTFAGGVEGEIELIEDQLLHVRVPEGAERGPITITTNFGETVSNFWYRDNRNIIASFDGTMNGVWHGPNYIKESDEDISNVEGKFIRMKSNLAAWGWFELYVGPAESDVALELKNIPEEAFAKPGDYSLKFEINTLKTLAGAYVRMYIGPDMAGQRGDTHYIWQPNVHTQGQWETITIPWEDVYEANKEFAYNPNGYGISMHFSGPNAVTGDFALDNMRVVPNTLE